MLKRVLAGLVMVMAGFVFSYGSESDDSFASWEKRLGEALSKGQPEALKAELREDLKINPEDPNRLYVLGILCQETNELDEAIDLLGNAADIFDREGQPGHAFQSRIYLAVIYQHVGLMSEAERVYIQLSKAAPDAGNDRNRGKAWHNYGVFLDMQSRHNEAISAYDEALGFFKKADDKKGQAFMLDYIGLAHAFMGDFAKAHSRMREAYEIWYGEKDRRGIAFYHNDAGIVSQLMGDWEGALVHYRTALEMRTEDGDLYGQAEALANLAVIYSKQDAYGLALKAYGKAEELFEKIEYPLGILETRHNIALMQMQKGRLIKAERQFTKILEEAHRLGARDAEASIWIHFAQLRLREKRWKEVKDCLRRAEALNRSIGSASLFWSIGNLKGDAAFMQGDYDAAVEAYGLALDGVERSRGTLDSSENKSSFLSGKIRVYERMLEALLKLGRGNQARHSIEVLESMKGRNLLDELHSASRMAELKMPQGLMARKRAIETRLSFLAPMAAHEKAEVLP